MRCAGGVFGLYLAAQACAGAGKNSVNMLSGHDAAVLFARRCVVAAERCYLWELHMCDMCGMCDMSSAAAIMPLLPRHCVEYAHTMLWLQQHSLRKS